MCIIDPNILYLGPNAIVLFLNRNFCQQGISPSVHPGLTVFQWVHHKKIRFRDTVQFLGHGPIFEK